MQDYNSLCYSWQNACENQIQCMLAPSLSPVVMHRRLYSRYILCARAGTQNSDTSEKAACSQWHWPSKKQCAACLFTLGRPLTQLLKWQWLAFWPVWGGCLDPSIQGSTRAFGVSLSRCSVQTDCVRAQRNRSVVFLHHAQLGLP